MIKSGKPIQIKGLTSVLYTDKNSSMQLAFDFLPLNTCATVIKQFVLVNHLHLSLSGLFLPSPNKINRKVYTNENIKPLRVWFSEINRW